MHLNLSFLRDAPWLNPERVRAYRNLLLAAQALTAIVIIVGARGGLDFDNRPIGTDFISFWTASELALSGVPAKAYDVATHFAAQRHAFGGAPLRYTAFFYPPVFLLICMPLALLPYGWALAAWLAVTGAGMLAAIGHLARRQLPALLAFPAVWLNIAHGQNGFLTTALFAGAALYLDTQPILAGILLGSLIFKPHFLLMVPVVLLAGWRWRTAIAAGVTATAWCGISLAVLGLDSWLGFFADSALARRVLEEGGVGHHKMQSLFAAIRLWGGGVSAAYIAQGLLAAGTAVVLAWICRRQSRTATAGTSTTAAETTGAALAAAALLASPFLLPYDMMLLAIPLLWLWRAARLDGFLPWEKAILALAFFAPMVTSGAALWLHLPLAPIVLLAVFASVIRRISSTPTEPR